LRPLLRPHSGPNAPLAQWGRRCAGRDRGASYTLADSEVLDSLADTTYPTPDAEFDRAWACAVLQQALDQLEAEMIEQNRALLFRALKPWLAGQATHGETTQMARQLNTTETALRVHLSRLRKRLRRHIESIVQASLSSEADPQAEIAALFAAFQSPS